MALQGEQPSLNWGSREDRILGSCTLQESLFEFDERLIVSVPG